jgi:CrcB protein
MLFNLSLVFLGGGIGSLSRYACSLLIRRYSDGIFPLGTLVANFLACCVMGLTLWLLESRANTSSIRLFLLTGFCGGFSTFSTFSMETLELFRRGQPIWAVLNIAVSFILCITVLAILIKKENQL